MKKTINRTATMNGGIGDKALSNLIRDGDEKSLARVERALRQGRGIRLKFSDVVEILGNDNALHTRLFNSHNRLYGIE